MVFFSSPKEGTAASNRLRRAQQLRQQRMATKQKPESPVVAKTATVATTPSKRGAGAALEASNSGDKGEEETLVVSGLCTLLCAFLIVCLGAGMATVFFMIHEPECMKGLTLSAASDARSFASPDFQQKVAIDQKTGGLRKLKRMVGLETNKAAIATTTDQQQQHPPPVTDSAGSNSVLSTDFTPTQCSADQLQAVSKQLPKGGCEKERNTPWRRMYCSFSAATSCSDPIWFREYHAQNSLPDGETFVSIHVGCNKGYRAVDFLNMATRHSRYNLQVWRSFFKKTSDRVEDKWDSCPVHSVAVPNAKEQPAKAFCIEPYPNTFIELERTKQQMQIGDELVLQKLALGMKPGVVKIDTKGPIGLEGVGLTNWNVACMNDPDCQETQLDSLDHWISQQTSVQPDDPIHYLGIGVEGHDYEVLAGSGKNLKRVQYLEFQYHWYGAWNEYTLKDAIDRLKRIGFVCYFAGDNNLWRVTDCWQEHYDIHFYANLACVNSRIPAVAPLARNMEDIFQRTIAKNIHFGENE